MAEAARRHRPSTPMPMSSRRAASWALTSTPPFRPGIAVNIGLIARMAGSVMTLPLAVEDEPAPVFRPGVRWVSERSLDGGGQRLRR